MEITDLDRSNNLLGHVGFGVQWDGEDASICYAAGRNDKPYTSVILDSFRDLILIPFESIPCARPKNLQLLEEYQPFVLWNI